MDGQYNACFTHWLQKPTPNMRIQFVKLNHNYSGRWSLLRQWMLYGVKVTERERGGGGEREGVERGRGRERERERFVTTRKLIITERKRN